MFKIGSTIISENHKPFVIAEMSGNHNQSLDRALAIVDAAAAAGAHALKLQTYTADTITFNGTSDEFIIKDENSIWKNQNLHQLYQQAYTPWEWHAPIFERAKSHGMIAFSSPFDTTAVDFLESLDVPCYKIASFENTDHILLKKVAQTNKPVIMSTGVSTIADIQESVKVLRDNGCKELVLLKCTSTYPATPESTNIYTIPHMSTLFDVPVGLSDHTMGIGVAIASVALGARIIEKHFTLSRADGGVDSSFSLEPEELKNLVVETERAFLSLGKVNYILSEKEKKSLQFKRSLYVVKDIKKGEAFTALNVRSIRPCNGLHTRYYDSVLTKQANQDIKAGTPLSLDDLR
ncbi:pseudaminic acid synthase [Cytophaga hutchinsonii]|uniref:N-acetylneuraminate synthase n=1 Tax=Cytophaga hutchinsonii (strain ATCC 33406 / DSM 1761 / CIP 103989 / NBRC 15051 / NCIMB 9469 / D465) TaxID=269798 RepID=A0A6N4SUL1_CYTH3|nr:pseudaminic acid synthase [Cytophaga hutchinsonii]ABG60008.1 N-acetylneuraminate synthase [Cytophaga hutchinsonii ATCC 33406]SFX25785.1 N-acetylneuraminate synthase [Cytophaga hutchinsonii ATCC 33406]